MCWQSRLQCSRQPLHPNRGSKQSRLQCSRQPLQPNRGSKQRAAQRRVQVLDSAVYQGSRQGITVEVLTSRIRLKEEDHQMILS